MAITLTNTFVSGAARDGSQVQQNLEDVRTWLAGQVATADIADNSGTSRCFLRPEHYAAPVVGSLCVSGDMHGDYAGMTKNERVMSKFDVSSTKYMLIPELARTIHVERAGAIAIFARYYAWAAWDIDINLGDPGYLSGVVGVAGNTCLFIDDTAVTHTTRRIVVEDWGGYSSVVPHKQEYSIHHVTTIAAGYHDIWMGIRTQPHSNTAALNPINDAAVVTFSNNGALTNFVKRIDIEVRSFRIDVDAFTP